MNVSLSVFGHELIGFDVSRDTETRQHEPKELLSGAFGFVRDVPIQTVTDPVKRWERGTPLTSPGYYEDKRR
ncbi:hypothetical protein RN2511_035950 [Rhodococcus sp. NKCM2511]|uniref:hypothetical protein n=1 Tax=Rhodococcus sp. NKCM2511 TaxID=2766011 RepID=UPI001910FACF|nr:hypothetical protein [Rhodococcus sp. NKCM2511]GHP18859.1 hypothetical protein RN2511_035950 [Rhodococcus sp. NKCM2511]